MANRMSKKTWVILTIVIIAIGAVVAVVLTHNHNRTSPSNSTLPIATWNETSLSTLQGTPVVLSFWSISCPWCMKQLPYLENVAQQSEGEIRIVAINIVDSATSIRHLFEDREPSMMIAVDRNREAFVDYCLAYNNTRGAIPFTLFVDSEGIVKYRQVGAFASETALWNALHDVFGITTP